MEVRFKISLGIEHVKVLAPKYSMYSSKYCDSINSLVILLPFIQDGLIYNKFLGMSEDYVGAIETYSNSSES